MAYKTLNTRIQLKYFEQSDLSAVANKVLLKGEVAAVHIPSGTKTVTGDDGLPKEVKTDSTVLFKVGDGVMGSNGVATGTAFKDLPWLSALAADVHAWAKKDWAGFVADVQANAGLVTAKTFDDYVAAQAALIGTDADELTATTILGKIAELEDIADAANELAGTKADAATTYNKGEVDNLVAGAKELVTGTNGVSKQIDDLGSAFATFRDTTAPATYAAKSVETTKADANSVYTKNETYTKSEVNALLDDVTGAEGISGLSGRIDDLETFRDTTVPGTYATKTEVSTAKSGAEATAKAYTDEKLEAFVAAYITDDGGTIDKLNEIADWINNDEAGVAEIIKDIDDLEAAVEELNKKELTDTTYTFASGTQGKFTVTPEGGSAQTIDTGAKKYTDDTVGAAIGSASASGKAATGIHAVIEAGDTALQGQIDDIESILENAKLTDNNTTYTFTDGEQGKFTVTGSDGSSKEVNTGAKAYVDTAIGTATAGNKAATGLHAVIEAGDKNLQDQIDVITDRFGSASDILILNGGTASTVW